MTDDRSNRYREKLTTHETETDDYVEIYDPENADAWIRAIDTVPVQE